MKLKEQITVTAKRWFDSKNGNTYHSCRVYYGDHILGGVSFTYGYDDQYKQTALDILHQKGMLIDVDYIKFTRDLGVAFNVHDVKRKSDLGGNHEVFVTPRELFLEGKKGDLDGHASTELYLYAVNDRDFKGQYLALEKRYRDKTYNFDKAIKVFKVFADQAAKKYLKEYGSPGDGDNVFSSRTRWDVAYTITIKHLDEMRLENFIQE